MIFKLASSTIKKTQSSSDHWRGNHFCTCILWERMSSNMNRSDLHHLILSHLRRWSGAQRSERLHMLMLTVAQRVRSATNLSLHIPSCVPLYSGGSTTWHERINCSEIGHDDKLFSSVCWQQYTFLFRSCLQALNARRGEKGTALSFMSKKKCFNPH